MAAFMRSYEGEAYALLRSVTGLLFLWHGMSKLFGFPVPVPEAPAFVIYVGGAIELVGGTLVMVGLYTGWAAFVCSDMMAVAYWIGHGTQALFPIVNKGELAILYCFAFLYISAKGGGRWSLDAGRKDA